jgi:hypothetical protein
VSISVSPRSMPSRSAATSSFRIRTLSPKPHVPCPSCGTPSPEGSLTVGRLSSGMTLGRDTQRCGARQAPHYHDLRNVSVTPFCG